MGLHFFDVSIARRRRGRARTSRMEFAGIFGVPRPFD